MKDSIKKRRKNLLALCLSVMMFSSVAGLAACGGDETDSSASDSSSSSSEMTSEVKDTGLIKNAGFEIANEDNVMNTSITGWQRSTNAAASGTAAASQAASGIIDLNKDAWHMLTGSHYDDPEQVKKLTEEEAERVWDSLTVRDRIAYGDQWKTDNPDGTITEDLEFYEKPNISEKDIPTIAHFDTHDKAVENGLENTKVLMIHNENPAASSTTATQKAIGTAQKYTSSSTVTVKAGTAAEFSVWVRTQDLQSSATDGSAQEAVDKGAYISVTHSVGGQTLDDFTVENINTENMAADELTNGWKQYTFLLKGASYADTTFSLVLGLGQGGGSYRGEYVNGYAFFDDIECKTITDDEYVQALTDLAIDSGDISTFEHEGEEKIVDVSKQTDRKNFALDFSANSFASATDFLADVKTEATTSKISGQADPVSSLAGQNPAKWLDGGFDGSFDVNEVFTSATAIGADSRISTNKYLKNVYDNHFANDTLATGNVLLMLSAKGAAYKAEPQMADPDDASAKIPYSFTVAAEGYKAISFFVKTSEMGSYTGAGITLVDGNNKTSFASIDTTTVEDIEDNCGWQQCFFFVENTAEAEKTFSLYFNFGPTAIEEGTGKDMYHEGFAAFTDFKVSDMNKAQYECAQAGTYAKLVTVSDEDEANKGNSFDSAKATPATAIETGLAAAQNYKGVYSDSAYIAGKGSSEADTYANAGLINKEHFLEYYSTTSGSAWIDGIKATAGASATADEAWNTVFGKDSTQPLFIWNDASNANKAYGYIGKSTNVAANSYASVSVRFKGNGSKVSLYLVDMDSANYGDDVAAYDQILSVGRNLTYWYDDDGNICTADPDEKSTYVAFKLQPNGLYKANKACTAVYSKLENTNAFYANLAAYTEKDDAGNLLVANGGASHNYNDYWNNEGMDGIAFYHKDGKYYADKACTVEVLDLSKVEALPKRYTAEDANGYKLVKENLVAKADEWTTVTFYIHTGDVAKNYRLELWSGTRSGASDNGEGKYVVFDYNNPGTAESNFTGLIAQYGAIEDEAEIARLGIKKMEGVFSYFDTANYLRYDASLDENNIGNLYEENYTPSANTEGVVYLSYVDGNEHNVFADYQYSEKAVTAAAADEDTDTDDSSDEEAAETNIWLLASSLSIAAVLILAVASIVIRKLVVKARKNKANNPKKSK